MKTESLGRLKQTYQFLTPFELWGPATWLLGPGVILVPSRRSRDVRDS